MALGIKEVGQFAPVTETNSGRNCREKRDDGGLKQALHIERAIVSDLPDLFDKLAPLSEYATPFQRVLEHATPADTVAEMDVVDVAVAAYRRGQFSVDSPSDFSIRKSSTNHRRHR